MTTWYQQAKLDIARRARERMDERERALANVVDRTPCPRCGTRADFGCKHSRRAA